MWDAQSVGISSLNHGSTISFGFNLTTPFFQKITPHLHRCYSVRVHCTYIYIYMPSKGSPICPSTAYEGAQTLHLRLNWMWDAVSRGL